MQVRLLTAALVVVAIARSVSAFADVPPVLLVENQAKGISLRLHRDALEALPETAGLITSSPWQIEAAQFRGVYLEHVLKLAEINTGSDVNLYALNDYRVQLPSDLRNKAFLAWAISDEYLQPEDKGYFWIIFDFDSMSKAETKAIQSYSIWQLYRIESPRE
ncbi:hypothetical protein [Minwuia sp.]|uniref:hypothetical protein n=1 Tax=Minwuia sp. TaxID=2493630 RepID=UPI003A8E9CB3